MRVLGILTIATAVLAGCGTDTSSGTGSGGPPPGKLVLQLQSNGNGVVKGAGQDCRGSCSVALDPGTNVHLQALADSGGSFAGWAGACSGTGTNCDLTVSANLTVVANFSSLPPPPPPPTTHKLTVSLDGQGRITSSPSGLDCSGATCAADFPVGTSVTLSAAPASTWSFAGWSGDCSGASCTLRMDKDASVTARFNAPPPPPANAHLIVAVDGPGLVTGAGVSCGSGAVTCDATVPAGSSQTLTATAASQARFIRWSGPCGDASANCSFTANGEVRVTATFSYLVNTLVANDGTNVQTLAINSTDAFYLRYLNSEGYSIWAVSKAGGQPRRVTSGYGSTMTADDGYVYWADSNSIYSAPVGGGSASLIFSGANGIGRLALDETGALYWTAGVWQAYQSRASVHRMQDRVDTVLVADTAATQAVAVDDRYVYFGFYDSAASTGELRRVPRKGGTAEKVISCGTYCQLGSLKTDFDNVYARSMRGEAWTVSKTNPTLRLLSGQNGTAGGGSFDIDANASVVYWNWVQYSVGSVNGIFAANADGTSWRGLDTGADYSWIGPRVDDSALYYWHSGSLLKRLK